MRTRGVRLCRCLVLRAFLLLLTGTCTHAHCTVNMLYKCTVLVLVHSPRTVNTGVFTLCRLRLVCSCVPYEFVSYEHYLFTRGPRPETRLASASRDTSYRLSTIEYRVSSID